MKYFALATTALFFIGVSSALPADSILAAHVTWAGPTGLSTEAPESCLSLLARDSDLPFPESGVGAKMFGAAAIWLRDHPKAIVVPIAVFPAPPGKTAALKPTFVWVTDGRENLNLALLK